MRRTCPLLGATYPQPQDWMGARRPSHSPRLAELSCAEPRTLEGTRRRDRGPATQTCPFVGFSGEAPRGCRRRRSPLGSRACRLRTAWCQSRSPARNRSIKRLGRLLFAARLCLGPGSYHGVWGCEGQALELNRPPATGASGLRASGPCVIGRRRPALLRVLPSPESAARRRSGCLSPCGSCAMVQPGS